MVRDERSSSLTLTNNCSLLQINFMAAKKKAAKKAVKKVAKKKVAKKAAKKRK
jgi:hypothetical protein